MNQDIEKALDNLKKREQDIKKGLPDARKAFY